MHRLLQWYGASPLHLTALVAGGALSAYAVSRVNALDTLLAIGVWFAGALVVHDLVLFPVYAAADSLATWCAHRAGSALPVAWLNHLRIPAAFSALLLLVWLPLILQLSPGYTRVTGRSQSSFLDHWLLVTGVLFAGSALTYAVRVMIERVAAARI